MLTAPVVLDQDINYYKNDYNDTHSTLKVPSNELNAWKVASNNTVNLVYTSGSYSETLKGSITLSTGQLLKANIGIYVLSLLIIVLIDLNHSFLFFISYHLVFECFVFAFYY